MEFKIQPALLVAFNDPSSTNCALKVRIESEQFNLAKSLASMQGADDATEFTRMREEFIVAAEACYILFVNSERVWHLFSFVPDDAPVRDKMLYSSSRSVLLKALGGGERIPRDEHWSGLEDIELKTSLTERARKAEERSVMTKVELMKLDADASAAAEAAGSKVTNFGGLSFPLSAEAQTGLDAFKSAALAALVLAIEGETVVQRASAAAATLAEVQKLLPTAAPCYLLYRWAHEREGSSTSACLFLYMCPEDAPVRAKMLHASTKGPFLNALTAGGLEIAKSVEGLETAELTEAELTTQLYSAASDAAAAGPAVVTKAAPRGGRKLVSRNRAAPTPELS